MSHATCSREELVALMDAETWLTPERSVELGLATATESDEDESEPTQSARRHVMHAIMGAKPVTVDVVAPTIDIEEVARRIAEQLMAFAPSVTATQEFIELKSDEPDPDEPQPEPEPQETAAQRFARIFQQLSE